MSDCVDNTTLCAVVAPYCIAQDAATNLKLTQIEGLIVTISEPYLAGFKLKSGPRCFNRACMHAPM